MSQQRRSTNRKKKSCLIFAKQSNSIQHNQIIFLLREKKRKEKRERSHFSDDQIQDLDNNKTQRKKCLILLGMRGMRVEGGLWWTIPFPSV